MPHALSLGLVLYVLWLLLSGIYEAWLMGLGALSCAFTVWVAARMDVVDHEGHPIHLRWGRLLVYLGWLGREIVVANIQVVRLILSRSMAITPTVAHVPASQRTDLGRVIYANSITLTPGTISIDVRDGDIEVHALTREGIEALLEGEMDRRVRELEGEPG
ncbi:MAG: Na+/H+ antiporter subunit E [Ectothiorhodospiraceae bacterium]|nr:Na+/H+ antiporter subunit E [Chromatiales bacterium]MCP5157197.1 Na+/H+ antiporter subunit E [Ectothiorhodospiraceae bacterium]